MKRDPLGEAGGINLYGMIENNVVNDSDLLGLSSNCCNGKKLGRRQSCCKGSKGERQYSKRTHGCCDGVTYKRMLGGQTSGKCCKDGEVLDSKAYWKHNNYASAAECYGSLIAGQLGWAAGAYAYDKALAMAMKQGAGAKATPGALLAIIASSVAQCDQAVCGGTN